MSRPRKELALMESFWAPRVLTLPQLCRTLRCSRSTILRRLAEHGYYSSYNHSGKYVTIPEIGPFD
jgi:predicted DNA-binding transcriptional regulator AlpA